MTNNEHKHVYKNFKKMFLQNVKYISLWFEGHPSSRRASISKRQHPSHQHSKKNLWFLSLAHIYFFRYMFENKKIFKVCDIFGHKKGRTTNFFLLLILLPLLDPGFGMEKNQDPGSGINIPDPQQCQKERRAEVGKGGKLDITAPAG
jgi:hypothetical protein